MYTVDSIKDCTCHSIWVELRVRGGDYCLLNDTDRLQKKNHNDTLTNVKNTTGDRLTRLRTPKVSQGDGRKEGPERHTKPPNKKLSLLKTVKEYKYKNEEIQKKLSFLKTYKITR